MVIMIFKFKTTHLPSLIIHKVVIFSCGAYDLKKEMWTRSSQTVYKDFVITALSLFVIFIIPYYLILQSAGIPTTKKRNLGDHQICIKKVPLLDPQWHVKYLKYFPLKLPKISQNMCENKCFKHFALCWEIWWPILETRRFSLYPETPG